MNNLLLILCIIGPFAGAVIAVIGYAACVAGGRADEAAGRK